MLFVPSECFKLLRWFVTLFRIEIHSARALWRYALALWCLVDLLLSLLSLLLCCCKLSGKGWWVRRCFALGRSRSFRIKHWSMKSHRYTPECPVRISSSGGFGISSSHIFAYLCLSAKREFSIHIWVNLLQLSKIWEIEWVGIRVLLTTRCVAFWNEWHDWNVSVYGVA